MKTGLCLLLAATPLVFALSPPPTTQSASQQGGLFGGGITYEPVLIYDLSGGTLSGPVRQTLTVYNNGTAHYSQLDGPGFSTGVSTYFTAPQQEVKELIRELKIAGADTLPDINIAISDVPLTTITFIKNPGTNAKAHSFSFFLQGPGYAEATQAIGNFLAKHGLGGSSS